MMAKRYCLTCGNSFDPSLVSSGCAKLYGETICEKCCTSRCILIPALDYRYPGEVKKLVELGHHGKR